MELAERPEARNTEGMGQAKRVAGWERSYAQVIPAETINEHRSAPFVTDLALAWFGSSGGNAMAAPLSPEDCVLLARTLGKAMGRDALLAAVNGKE